MSKVVFSMEDGSRVSAEGNPGETLLELACRVGIALDAPCAGNGTCGKCRVKILAGSVDSMRIGHLTHEEWEEGWRLACGAQICEDVTVFVPAGASAFRSRLKVTDFAPRREQEVYRELRQALTDSGVAFRNSFRQLEMHLEPPTLVSTLPDCDRLSGAIREKTGAAAVEIPYPVLRRLAPMLRQNAFGVCVLGRMEGERFVCMELRRPGRSRMAACAVDIGTTSVSMVLADLEDGRVLARGSAGNAQIRFGADVISRIIRQGRPGGREELQKAIVEETLNPLLHKLCSSIDLEPGCILRVAVGANPTMNHLLLGLDADTIRREPYIPSFFGWEGLTAGDLGLETNPLARIVLAPNIGSYVGGDITAGTFASRIWDSDGLRLLIDLGTNGEIVLGSREFLMSCACSAGPAFEGGEISCGMRATDGAVEACTLDPDTLTPRLTVVGGGRPAGLCGSGIIDLIAELFRCGAINARGSFVRENSRIRRDAHGCGRYVLAGPEASAGGREIALTEVDIDNFIRAKGAVYAAVVTLLETVGMDESMLERVYVAGGIGSGINMRNAVRIGMLPDLSREKFFFLGNTSLLGSWAMAVSEDAERQCARVARNMTYVELSADPGYMDAFVAACFLPHTDAGRFPSLQKEKK